MREGEAEKGIQAKMLKKVEEAAGRILTQARSVFELQRHFTDSSPKYASFHCFRQHTSLGLRDIYYYYLSVFSKASLRPQGSSH